MASFSAKVRVAGDLLKIRAEHAFQHASLAPELQPLFVAGFVDASLQRHPTITDPNQSRNSAAYVAGYSAGMAQQSCPSCGAVLSPAGACDFCPSKCYVCDAPRDGNGACVNPDCETRGW